MDSSPENISRLLQAIRSGNQDAASALMRIIHPELRRLAGDHLRDEPPEQTLQATALVNELCLRLAPGQRQLENSAHLRAAAAQGLREILLDHTLQLASPEVEAKVMALEKALQRLSQWDPRQARVVQLHFYGGMTDTEIGEVLEMPAQAVKRDWKQARAWLYDQIGGLSSDA